MKVLWIVNSIFPYPADQLGMERSCFGGWLHSLYSSIKNTKDFEIAIVATYGGKDYKKFVEKNTSYYLIPSKKLNKYDDSLEKHWKRIIEDYNPDIVHIQGTEYPKSLPLIRQYPKLNYVVSIQGLVIPYSRVANSNLTYFTLFKNISIRDVFKPYTGILTKYEMTKRSKYERELLLSVKSVIGRTTWDKAETIAVNPKLNYFHCEENLRKSFYTDSWDENNIKKHTIFFSQAQSIIKGFNIMIEALKILRVKYPDVTVIVAGNDLFKASTLKDRLKRQSYTRYLLKLVKKYNLQENIKFTGYLDETNMKKKLLKSNVYVQASSIENSSNSLGEAMILGIPCVASNVGGTSDMLIDKKEGFLYPYTEPELLAYYISQYFEDDNLCKSMGIKARKHAIERHDWENNSKKTLEIYNSILNK